MFQYNESSRWPVQDIINAFYIYELFKNFSSIEIGLVIDINDVANDNIN